MDRENRPCNIESLNNAHHLGKLRLHQLHSHNQLVVLAMVPERVVAQELVWERELVQAAELGKVAVVVVDQVTRRWCSRTVLVQGSIQNLGLQMGKLNHLGSMNFQRNHCHLRKAQDLR